MKSLVLLLCLAQLWDCHSAPSGPGLGYTEIDCFSPEAEEMAMMAVQYLNEHNKNGYKHTLNQIDKLRMWPRRPYGEAYELEIDTLETTCHVRDPTPLANCSVRQLTQHAVEGDCDFRLLKVDGQISVTSVKCHASPDSAEDVRKICPDCPLLAHLNDTRVVHAVEAALAAFNAQNNGSYFKLAEISRAQFVPLPVSTSVEFAIAATDCIAKEVVDPASCNMLPKEQYGFCKATLFENLGGEEVSVKCTLFQTQPVPEAPGTNTADPSIAVDPAPPAILPAGPPAASLVAGPMVMVDPPEPPLPRVHHDLRHTFPGVPSMESASGEVVHVGGAAVVNQPRGGIVGTADRLCPGRVIHFKI